MSYTYRHLARVTIEAVTPIAVGSGQESVLTDRLVVKDVNGLPYLPGTSLAGILRQALTTPDNKASIGDFFGFVGEGSRFLISSAHLVGTNSQVVDGLWREFPDDTFLNRFYHLPIRQHVRLSHKGASEEGGKFDEEVVFKGTRFCFELELVSERADEPVWRDVIGQLYRPDFRVGGGTRKGFGEIKVIECKTETIDLAVNLDRYLEKTSSLADEDGWWNPVPDDRPGKELESGWIAYEVTLEPQDFFLFGSGFGTEDADMGFVTEPVIEWEGYQPRFSESKVLIPAASVKGAIAHRVAFHFNKDNQIYADTLKSTTITNLLKKGYQIPSDCESFSNKEPDDCFKMITDGNPAVRKIFGYVANEDGQRGNVIFSDIFLEQLAERKLLNHVAIDRFTGGAIDGALFHEEVAQAKEQFKLKIFLNMKEIQQADYINAFEKSLDDLCSGRLPLGGGTMRGHGCFKGSFIKKSRSDEK